MLELKSNWNNAMSKFNITSNPEDADRLYVQVGKFEVHINHTPEGVIVDVWPFSAIGDYAGDSLSSCSAMNDDADAALEEDDA